MQRIKIPFGGLNAPQLEMLADLCEEYSDGIAHITTRQDIQLHFIHIEDTPALMRRLAAVGITTREACGNSVRNVPPAPSPASAASRPSTSPPTPKPSRISCSAIPTPSRSDANSRSPFPAAARTPADSSACTISAPSPSPAKGTARPRRGFELWVGGGLGPVPQQARLYDEFVPEEEILPDLAGHRPRLRAPRRKEKPQYRAPQVPGQQTRHRGIQKARRSRARNPPARSPLDRLSQRRRRLQRGAAQSRQLCCKSAAASPEGFDQWLNNNVYRQRQPGYATVTIALPLGDITATQLRAPRRHLAQIREGNRPQHRRTKPRPPLGQRSRSPALYTELKQADLAAPVAGTIVDVSSCPGTDTCKLGIASSRGLAGELRTRLAAKNAELDEAIGGLRIKVSGCFNSCGQHHVADLGFYGVSRNKNGYTVPHFQVLLGGEWANNAGSYGLAIGAVPSKRIPETVDRITGRYRAERHAKAKPSRPSSSASAKPNARR